MRTVLNWSDPAHWSPSRRACVHCGSLTNLRDAAGRAAHKVCVERLVDQLRRERRHLRSVQPTERTAS